MRKSTMRSKVKTGASAKTGRADAARHGSRQPMFETMEPRLLLDSGPIAISEIMFHPGFGDPGSTGYVAEDTRQEYIELYNKGAEAVNLNGWAITQGVDFTFGDRTMNPGEYLVVAADVAQFQLKYPTVTNVIGGWTGQLSNSGEAVELEDAVGNRVDYVAYADEGDWALRRQGPLYPSNPSWWRGWDWVAPADAGGKSLELVNPDLSNEYGQNWAASTPDQGTPGAANSVRATDVAPIILDVKHLPVIPKSSDPVTITAKLVDELGTADSTATLHYRKDGAPSFSSLPMFDDGLHGDGVAGDGVFGVILPANPIDRPDKTIVEFYVESRDAGGRTRTWPAPTDTLGNQGANALYQVDDSTYSGTQPIYRIIVPATEWTQWTALMGNSTGAHSAVAMNGTFLSVDGGGTEVRYLSSFGNRGESTRHAVPHNIEAMFPSDHPWNGKTKVGFNTRTTYSQAAGNAIFAMAGMPANYGTPVQMRVNGNNLANATPTGGSDTYQYGSYYMFEPYNTEWADQYFPEDSAGNIYKGIQTGSTPADFSYRGINPASYYGSYVAPYGLNGGYSKQTNASANDWSDLIHLTDVLNNTPDATYAAAVSQVINVDEWMKYFAINSLIGNRENSLGGLGSYGTLVADDYSMYAGVLDPRFQLLVHDLDTVLGEGDYDTGWNNTPFQFEAADCAAIERLLKSQDFAPLYFAAFKEQIETTFSAAVINPLLDQVLGGWIPNSVIQSMKDYAAARAAYVLAQIPLTLTAASALTQQSNYPRSTTATTTVTGTANAIDTRRILVNGVEATYTAWTGTWSATNVTLRPGINRVLVQALGVGNVEVGRTFIDIWYDTLATRAVSGTLPVGTTTWTAGNPYQVSGTLTIPAGATLIIQPGVTVFFDAGAKLLVNGRLDAQGTSDLNRIRFTKTPAAASNWAGIEFNYTSYSSQVNRISYADIEYSDSGSYAIKCVDGQVVLDHIRFARHNKQYLTFDDSSLILRDSYLSDITGAELFHFWGMPATGYAIIEGNFFGKTTGYNDIIDLTGGNRPGPIAQFINNTFSGGGDDCIDLDGTDAQVEGNIFYNIKTDDPGRESQSHAVTTGTEGGLYSEVTVVRNLFYNVDHALLVKDGGYMTAVNNTIVGASHAAVNCYEVRSGQWQGLGIYLDGNIIVDTPHLFENPDWAGHPLTLVINNSIIPDIPADAAYWTGTGNLTVDPGLTKTTGVTDLTQDFRLRPGSPAIGAGPNGLDMGGLVPAGASITGEPLAPTWQTGATLTVGGPDIYGYKYRVYHDGIYSAWSGQVLRPTPVLPGTPVPVLAPILLTGLTNGIYRVEVIELNSAGVWRSVSDANLSRTWVVNTALAPAVRINEVLADNRTVDSHGGLLPDIVELYSSGQGTMDLSDMSLSDNPANPRKFVFGSGASLAQGQYLTLYGGTDTVTPANHLGFSLKAGGDTLYLYDSPARGGGLVDSVTFGIQLPDQSIGRGPDAAWGLAQPTFGTANTMVHTGNPLQLKINEWLADGKVAVTDDYIELYNPGMYPVDMGGLYLSDSVQAVPHMAAMHQADPTNLDKPAPYAIPALSFIAASTGTGGLTVFTADGDTAAGADHTDFKLSSFQGAISLYGADMTLLDRVVYGPQTTDVSQGRTPLAASSLAYELVPTPGIENTGITYGESTGTTTTRLFGTGATDLWRYNQSNADLGTAWYATSYSDSAWLSGAGVFYNKASQSYAEPKRTLLAAQGGSTNYPYHTYYFRTHFTFSGDISKTTLVLNTILDDGAVVYINGQEAERLAIDDGITVVFLTHSNRTVGTAAYETWTLPATALVQGDNVIAVEVHQCNDTSSDIVWAATLDAQTTNGNATIVRQVNLPAAISGLANGLRITEMMYNPVGGDHEFIELKNTGATTLVLTGVRLSGGVDFTFPARTLAPNQYVLVVANLTAFRSRYGTGLDSLIAGQYTGHLSDGGEEVVLGLPAPYEAAALRFDYSGVWYPTTNGGGYSLAIVNPAAARATWFDRSAWKASVSVGGSPGRDEPATPGGVVISEVLTHTDFDPPAGIGDWIEIYNSTGAEVDIGNWYLTDRALNPADSNQPRYQIPALTKMAAGERLVFNERDHFGLLANPSLGFALSELGEEVHLTRVTGGVVDYHEMAVFGASQREVSFGRYTTSTGAIEFVPMSTATPGDPNAYPMVGPVVINEFMYNPAAGGDEFIELRNLTGADVPLYDPVLPANTWRFNEGPDDGGVYYYLPLEAYVPASGYALVVQGSPTTFRTKYGIAASVPIYGGYSPGALSNGGEAIQLQMPGDPEPGTGFVPYYRVDRVVYDDEAGWPATADGNGPSLERVISRLYGNDVVNWVAGPTGGTAGRDNAAMPPRVTSIRTNAQDGRGPSSIDPSGRGVRTIEINFSENVTFNPTDVIIQTISLVDGVETVTGTLTPTGITGSTTNRMTVTLPVGAAVDTWLKIRLVGGGTLRDTSLRRLDGEARAGGTSLGYIFDGARDLPSGDEILGGDAVFYVGSLRGDFRGTAGADPDGLLTEEDAAGFMEAYAAKSLDADFRGAGFGVRPPDGRITVGDLDGFIAVYQAGVVAGRQLGALPGSGTLAGEGLEPAALPQAADAAPAGQGVMTVSQAPVLAAETADVTTAPPAETLLGSAAAAPAEVVPASEPAATEVDGWWLDVAPLAPAASAPVVAAVEPAIRDVAIVDLAAEAYAADPVLLPEGGLLDPLAVPAMDLALPV